MRKKLKLTCLVAPLAALTFLALSGPASAQTAGSFFADPQDTNVPYVAWVGDKVRLVKCVSNHTGGVGDFALVDWSGVNANGAESIRPSFLPSNAQSRPSFGGSGDQWGRTCYDIVVTSEKPGLAKIKLETRGGSPSNITHDFLVIFLSMNQPVLTELADDAYPNLSVGDPEGDGIFEPLDCSPAAGFQGCFPDGYFQVDVTGSFPLGNNYADDIAGMSTATLPDDWEVLANRYGVSVLDAVDPSGWDIHDDQIDQAENTSADHSVSAICAGTNLFLDEVDNCTGRGGELGEFSRLVGGTYPTVGPFDPLRPSTSYLPDGKVDSGDAPMPALRIDVGVSGGFGALESANKHVLYSRDGTGNFSDNPLTSPQIEGRHNLYAPFYGAFIPATRAEGVQVDSRENPPLGTSSGTTGDLANNFPGFQGNPNGARGFYHYWDLLNRELRDGENDCFDVGGNGQVGDDEDGIHLPAGVDSATVYTDEHGQAIVRFRPDVGVELEPNNQGLCDLGEISDTPRLIATATISAQAELPFQQAERPIDAAPLTKQLFSLAGKSLDCVPKNPIEVFCVEVIRDIRGNPVSGATVVFSADPMDRILGAQLELGGYNTTGAPCSAPNASDEVTCTTNSRGQAGVVVVQTRPELVNVVAENARTRNGGFGVIRDRCVRFFGNGSTLPTDGPNCATPTDTVIPTTPTTPTTPSSNNTGSTNTGVAAAQSNAVVVSLAGTSPVAAKAPAAKAKAKATAKLASAKLVVVKGKRYLVVRANGTAKSVKLRIVLVMRTGKVMKPVIRTVRTNRAVRVSKLQISKHVRTVRVSRVVR